MDNFDETSGTELYIDDILEEIGVRTEINTNNDSSSKIISVIKGIVMQSQDQQLKLKINDILDKKVKVTEQEKETIIDLIKNSPIKSNDELKNEGTYSGITIVDDGNVIIQDASFGHDVVPNHNTVVSIVYDKELKKVIEIDNKGSETLIRDSKRILYGS